MLGLISIWDVYEKTYLFKYKPLLSQITSVHHIFHKTLKLKKKFTDLCNKQNTSQIMFKFYNVNNKLCCEPFPVQIQWKKKKKTHSRIEWIMYSCSLLEKLINFH